MVQNGFGERYEAAAVRNEFGQRYGAIAAWIPNPSIANILPMNSPPHCHTVATTFLQNVGDVSTIIETHMPQHCHHIATKLPQRHLTIASSIPKIAARSARHCHSTSPKFHQIGYAEMVENGTISSVQDPIKRVIKALPLATNLEMSMMLWLSFPPHGWRPHYGLACRLARPLGLDAHCACNFLFVRSLARKVASAKS